MRKIKVISFVLCVMILLCSCSSVAANDLCKNIKTSSSYVSYDFNSETLEIPKSYDEFIEGITNTSFSLLDKSNNGDSIFISPVSLLMALCMTENGASGNTSKELLSLISNDLEEKEINNCMSYLRQRLIFYNNEDSKLNLANSIWINNNGLQVKEPFLQRNVDYYNAGIFSMDFSDKKALETVNKYISDNTDDMIVDMLKEINPSTVMMLINAISFNDSWARNYQKDDIVEGVFHGDSKETNVSYLHSNDESYIKCKDAVGFIKGYENTPIRFVALLPNEGISVDEFVSSLDYEKWSSLFDGLDSFNLCECMLPKFELNSSVSMKDVLETLNVKEAFEDSADFSRISDSDGLKINDVLHSTYINVDENGTKAAAATVVDINTTAMPLEDEDKPVVNLDRPFVFALVDNESNIPVFMGIIKDI